MRTFVALLRENMDSLPTEPIQNNVRIITRATSRNSESHKEVNRPKERICDKVLRDEDEETDDEDLTIDSSSPVISNSKCYILKSYINVKHNKRNVFDSQK